MEPGVRRAWIKSAITTGRPGNDPLRMLISFATEAYPQSDAAEWARPSSVQRLASGRDACSCSDPGGLVRANTTHEELTPALARKRVLFPWHLAILLFSSASLPTFNIARPHSQTDFVSAALGVFSSALRPVQGTAWASDRRT